MQILYSLTLCVVLFLSSIPSLKAEDQCLFSEWKSLFASVTQNAGEVRLYKSQNELLDASRSVASLTPAPRFAAQVYKDFDHIGDGEIEASYLLVWENEKKKQSRERVVDASMRRLEFDRDLTRAKLKVQLMVGLYRLQQIGVEQAALQESKETYHRLSGKLKALPALSPEQQLTLSIFQMAEDESQTKISLLIAERVPYERELARLTACRDPKLSFVLALPRTLGAAEENVGSPSQLTLQSELKIASAEKEEAEISLERDIEVGPIFRMNRDRDASNVAAGIAFSLPLNGAQRSSQVSASKARYQAKLSEVELKLAQIDNEKSRWASQFKIAGQSLATRWDLSELSKRHKIMESLFASGRINASLIIEGHRQILESLKARHAMETLAFESYWNVLFLSGTILEDQKL